MSARPWVTVVGNGVAGLSCARSLAAGGARVTLIGPGLPCDRPPLSKRALLTGRAPYLATVAELAEAGIEHVDGRAEDLNLPARTLTVRTNNGDRRPAVFEQLVWATGLRPTRPPVAGIDLAGENADPESFERLTPHIASSGRRVVVIGAGLIGTETAATLAVRHHVTLLERADRPLDRFHAQVSSAAREALQTLGVDFRGGCSVERIERLADGRRAVHLQHAGCIIADTVISAAGVASTLPQQLGDDYAETDERLAAVGGDSVWVCGDLARYPHPRYGRISVPHWDNARAGGAHAAAAILGANQPFVHEPYWFSDIGPLRIQQIGNQSAACEWRTLEDLTIGHDDAGRPACVLLINAPRRLAEARRLLAA
jgi:NADPH-dependent 2,4-dienoyl-CoA reductase/sulfur reductase-like enzyme